MIETPPGYRIEEFNGHSWSVLRANIADRDHAIETARNLLGRAIRVVNERGAKIWESDRDE